VDKLNNGFTQVIILVSRCDPQLCSKHISLLGHDVYVCQAKKLQHELFISIIVQFIL